MTERTLVLDRPRLRGTTHVVAAGAAVLATVVLAARADTPAYRWAVVVYGVTMIAMFATSAAYHRGRWSVPARRRMKALDHTTIFGFILGSHTPLAVLVLGGSERVAFLGSLLVVVSVGAALKLRRLDRLGGPADAVYGVATWWVLVIAGTVVRALSPVDLALVLGGLVLYSLGAGLLAGRWLDPVPSTFGYHELAHAVALLGTACHYALYWRVLA